MAGISRLFVTQRDLPAETEESIVVLVGLAQQFEGQVSRAVRRRHQGHIVFVPESRGQGGNRIAVVGQQMVPAGEQSNGPFRLFPGAAPGSWSSNPQIVKGLLGN